MKKEDIRNVRVYKGFHEEVRDQDMWKPFSVRVDGTVKGDLSDVVKRDLQKSFDQVWELVNE